MRRPVVTVALLVALAVPVGCAPHLETVVKHQLRPAAAGPIEQGGLTVSVTALDQNEVAADPRLAVEYTVNSQNSANNYPTTHKSRMLLLGYPVFEVRIANGTGHVISTRGALVKLADSAGNLSDLNLDKDKIIAATAAATSVTEADVRRQYPSDRVWLEPGELDRLQAAVRALRFFSSDAQILPGTTETYLMTFDIAALRSASGKEDLDRWLASQSQLTLRIYELAAETDDAGNPTKRVQIEYPIAVKTTQETWKISPPGWSTPGKRELVSSEEIAKK